MTKSDTIAEIAKALALAQAEMRGAVKDSVNPHLRSKYADLASVWEACREPLTKNGLSVVQSTRMEGSAVVVVTMLLHSSGEYISGEISLPPVKTDPQGHGSAITYARRYALAAMVGVSPEDDDGNDGSDRGKGHDDPKKDKKEDMKKDKKEPPASTGGKKNPQQWADEYLAAIPHLKTLDEMRQLTQTNAAALIRLDKVAPQLRDKIVMALAEKKHQIEAAQREAEMTPFQ